MWARQVSTLLLCDQPGILNFIILYNSLSIPLHSSPFLSSPLLLSFTLYPFPLSFALFSFLFSLFFSLLFSFLFPFISFLSLLLIQRIRGSLSLSVIASHLNRSREKSKKLPKSSVMDTTSTSAKATGGGEMKWLTSSAFCEWLLDSSNPSLGIILGLPHVIRPLGIDNAHPEILKRSKGLSPPLPLSLPLSFPIFHIFYSSVSLIYTSLPDVFIVLAKAKRLSSAFLTQLMHISLPDSDR